MQRSSIYKLADFGGFFAATLFYHLVCSVFNLKRKSIILFGYGQAILFNVLNFSTNWVAGETRFVFGIHYVKTTPLLTIATLLHILIATFSFVELSRFLNHRDDLIKFRARYIAAGFLIGFASGTSTLLPEFGIDILYPVGNFGVFIYAAILSYAILYHRILDFEEITKLVQREKLAAIGTLAASINHEIRNPLYIIQGLAQSHLENLKDNIYRDKETAFEKSGEILKKTADQAARAMEIMKQFAVFAKQRVGQAVLAKEVHLNDILESVLPLIRHELELDKIGLSINISENLPPLRVDPRQLEEILFNLIVNSCQAMKSGGKIQIAAERYNGSVNVKVEDTGPGINPDQLKRIF